MFRHWLINKSFEGGVVSDCGWQEVGLQAKGRCGQRVRQLPFMSGRHSTLFTHMIFWAFLPLFLSIIHGCFNRVIPLTTFQGIGPRHTPWPHSLEYLDWTFRPGSWESQKWSPCSQLSQHKPSWSPACAHILPRTPWNETWVFLYLFLFNSKCWKYPLGRALLRQRSKTYYGICKRSEERKARTSEAS